MVPVAASNRIRVEKGESCSLTFYGSSFLVDSFGEFVVEADGHTEMVLKVKFDLDELCRMRLARGIFSDRLPEL